MALVKCIECGREISDKVDTCVNCGCPNYIKLYENSGLRTVASYLSISRAIKILFEANNIKGYKNEVNNEQDPRTWISSNLEFLEENITLDLVKSLSVEAEKDYGIFNDVISHHRKAKNERIEKAKKAREEASIKRKCKDCGCFWILHDGTCKRCGGTELEEVRIDVLGSEEANAFYKAGDLISYAMQSAFEEVRPKLKDRFGAIELCEYMNEKYNNQIDFNKAIAVIWHKMFSLKHAGFGHNGVGKTQFTDDGRKIDYRYYFYDPEKEEGLRFYHSSEDERKAIDRNPIENLKKCVTIIDNYKAATFADKAGDYDYSIEQMKAAREEFNKVVDEFEGKQKQRETNQAIRNKVLEDIAEMANNADPNKIKGAKCPTCGSTSVYKIGTIKRAGTIAAFGLLSRNIGKTMECKSCGYKW